MDTRLYKWQKKLLPWMIILPSFLIVVFVVPATIQFRALSIREKYSENYLKTLVEAEMNDIGMRMNIEVTPGYTHWMDETHQKIGLFQAQLKKIIAKKSMINFFVEVFNRRTLYR